MVSDRNNVTKNFILQTYASTNKIKKKTFNTIQNGAIKLFGIAIKNTALIMFMFSMEIV